MGSIPIRACTVDGCEGKHEARGLCKKHYRRFKRSPEFTFAQPKTLEQRFWERVKVKGPDDCWVWIGAFSESRPGLKYGKLDFQRPGSEAKETRATHVSLFLATGKWLPQGILACHTCDNPICVNPKHLFAGTPYDNTQDMINKGRSRMAANVRRGKQINTVKLDETQVKEIRCLRAAGLTITALGKKFGVHHGQISKICSRKSWKHVK